MKVAPEQRRIEANFKLSLVRPRASQHGLHRYIMKLDKKCLPDFTSFDGVHVALFGQAQKSAALFALFWRQRIFARKDCLSQH